MRLSPLLADICELPITSDCEIAGLTLNSKQVKSHDAFVVLAANHKKYQLYIEEAISHGARAILIDASIANTVLAQCKPSIPVIVIRDLQHHLGKLSARFYKHPAHHLHLLGVTGTNGKTSCTHFIAHVLKAMGKCCGLIGTLGSGLYGDLVETGYTTPDAILLQALLSDLRIKGADTVAMEVSSHSIAQGRINGLTFETGIFTNLTQDHLDYHGTMQAYAAVKYRFLAEDMTRQVIINQDDTYGKEWIAELASAKPVYSYSLQSSAAISRHVLHSYADHITRTAQGIAANIHTPWGHGELLLPLIGDFNLSNALATLIALCLYGVQFETALQSMASLKPVPGRMQTFHKPNGALIIVDFAHTPDALEKVLISLRAHVGKNIICIFGCGGDRDQEKRPLMAQIAEQYADQVIVTSDNPRHEDAIQIIEQIKKGFAYPHKVRIEPDRSQAILDGIQLAGSHDCVLIAGKGAERYQQIGDVYQPFDDAEQVLSSSIDLSRFETPAFRPE